MVVRRAQASAGKRRQAQASIVPTAGGACKGVEGCEDVAHVGGLNLFLNDFRLQAGFGFARLLCVSTSFPPLRRAFE